VNAADRGQRHRSASCCDQEPWIALLGGDAQQSARFSRFGSMESAEIGSVNRCGITSNDQESEFHLRFWDISEFSMD
jgi:hypothetical protein